MSYNNVYKENFVEKYFKLIDETWKVYTGSKWADFTVLNMGKGQKARLVTKGGNVLNCDTRHEVFCHTNSIKKGANAKARKVIDLNNRKTQICTMQPMEIDFPEVLPETWTSTPKTGNARVVTITKEDHEQLWYWVGFFMGDGSWVGHYSDYKDYYDFYQGIYRDNSLVFDRQDSYNLSKKEFASYFNTNSRYHGKDNYKFILLQICNTFWLFKLNITKTDNYGICSDYTLELRSTWKDYNAKREKIKLSHIQFNYFLEWQKTYTIQDEINCIKNKDYRERQVFNKFTLFYSNKHETKTIPLLKNIGIPGLVEPLDIYLAFEEYFSLEKTDTEKTESIGLTNNEKITNHGFNLKTSFRGKD